MALATAPTFVDYRSEGPTTLAYVDRITFPGDTSYPTGGSANFQAFYHTAAYAANGLTPAGRKILSVQGHAVVGGVLHHCVYDFANDKLLVYTAAAGTEVAAATNLSGVTFTAVVISK
jgi:hypothetical protein